MTEIKSSRDVRQGGRGKTMLVVLGTSVGLMLIALVGLMTWNGNNTPTGDGSQNQVSPGNSTMGSAGHAPTGSSSTTTGVPSANQAYPQPGVRNANP